MGLLMNEYIAFGLSVIWLIALIAIIVPDIPSDKDNQ